MKTAAVWTVGAILAVLAGQAEAQDVGREGALRLSFEPLEFLRILTK